MRRSGPLAALRRTQHPLAPELLAKYRAQGAQVLAYGGDFALAQVLADCRRDFDQALGE